MGGFSDNYECGYWDEDMPSKKIINKTKKYHTPINKKYQEEKDEEYCYIKVLLTPLHTLESEAKDVRVELTQMCSTQTELSLVLDHSTNNIVVYHEDICIGFVVKIFEEEKIDNTTFLNDFCFNDNGVSEVKIFWSGEYFFLSKKIV